MATQRVSWVFKYSFILQNSDLSFGVRNTAHSSLLGYCGALNRAGFLLLMEAVNNFKDLA